MKNLFVEPDITLKDALKKLSLFGEKCLVVVNKTNKTLLGTLSDGDIRKAILRGNEINTSIKNVYKKNPFYINSNNYKIENAKKLFLKHKIDLIPVVDENKKVVDIIIWNKLFDQNKKTYKMNLPVIIMAGGKGLRLEPFTKVLPKPLIPINGKPIIEHIIEKFLNFGLNEFYITVNYKSRILKAYFEEAKKNYKIKFIEEKEPLGTAGSLRLLQNKIKKPFFVTNCDIILDVNFFNFYNFHKENKNDISFIASTKNQIVPYGICHLDKNGEFDKIKEKHSSKFLVNAGLYLLQPNLTKIIPKKVSYHMTQLINDAKIRNKKIGIFPVFEDSWLDVGHWSEYKKTIEKIKI